MTLDARCPCGATLTVDDASELATGELLERWMASHSTHRESEEEMRTRLTLEDARMARARETY